MQAAIKQSQGVREALRQEVITATEAFRSKSRFFVTQSGAGWAVVSASDNRVYGRNTSYPQAVRYAQSLERAIDAKTLPVVAVVKVKEIGESATRWASLFALALILLAGAASS
ncbi:hypothetical protein [Pseudomonas guariconensis]|uniref:hypothetical protein n=1 Tax=Pseudomonas guariconensis TaxID=1288410 RepID=UPI0025A968D6|nr:hypothetical protein [Pseudomonas guariconensis]MDM9594687.1 hypothetical protein [Pseudomonas guariconensis]MDM9607517.1 hypothetical protein [Pseudomonas guariconensis]